MVEASPSQRSESRRKTLLRRIRKIVFITALTAIVLSALLFLAGVWFVRRSWPQVAGNISVSGLQAPVEVIRDHWGVAHIFAQNTHDLFFSQGYAQAQDRMWQMEFTRRIGSGRLSEVLGSETVGIDERIRTLGLRRAADRDWENMRGEDRAVLEAYAEGVNAYLDANRSHLSIEFSIFRVEPERWAAVDSLVIVKIMSWVLSENASIEISRARILAKAGETSAREMLPPYSEGAPVIVPPEVGNYDWLRGDLVAEFNSVAKTLGTVGASNSWVIAGNRTATGKPLLANDTHLDFLMPSNWYANGLHGGDFDVVGYSLAGTPGVSIGHNRRIAWGLTDLIADVQDLYVEKLDDQSNPKRYEFRGAWRPLERATEEIRVRGEKNVTVNTARTNRGPLVSRLSKFKDSRPLSLAWASLDSQSMIASLLLLNRAANWNEFRRSLSFWDGPNINFVYADVEGNIGYQAAARIPLRAPAHQGITPAPGWTGEYEWRGFVPFEGLPHSFNPPAEFIVAANQKPVPDNYPYRLGYEWADPFRAIRITQMLSENKQVSLADSERMQGDTYHLLAKSLLPHILSIQPAGNLEAAALAELRSWNLNCDPDQAGAAIFQVWYRFLVEETVGDELGRDLTIEYLEYYWVHGPAMMKLIDENRSRLFDDLRTEVVETREDIIHRSLTKTVAWLSERYGPDPRNWKWGRVHTMRLAHRPFGGVQIPILSDLFNYGPIAAPGGDRFTVNATWLTWDDSDHPFVADAGASQRIVIDLGDWDRSVGINSTGQSEHLFHPHREDLIPLWQNLKCHPLLFTRKAIEAETLSILKLTPTTTPNK
jgi:penicillin amidase